MLMEQIPTHNTVYEKLFDSIVNVRPHSVLTSVTTPPAVPKVILLDDTLLLEGPLTFLSAFTIFQCQQQSFPIHLTPNGQHLLKVLPYSVSLGGGEGE
jgi:hypothetical protein